MLCNRLVIFSAAFSGNDNVETGFFAPGTTGTYSIVLDTTNADVSVDFEFNVDSSVFADHDNITFTMTSSDLNLTYSNLHTYSLNLKSLPE